mmetsp:Transcript_8782/g.21718  ORF Transcript_8782/g.21718 Transcript_8782/m.21718 type:complete len:279 (+) Transcript_8782:648-1484(+)
MTLLFSALISSEVRSRGRSAPLCPALMSEAAYSWVSPSRQLVLHLDLAVVLVHRYDVPVAVAAAEVGRHLERRRPGRQPGHVGRLDPCLDPLAVAEVVLALVLAANLVHDHVAPLHVDRLDDPNLPVALEEDRIPHLRARAVSPAPPRAPPGGEGHREGRGAGPLDRVHALVHPPGGGVDDGPGRLPRRVPDPHRDVGEAGPRGGAGDDRVVAAADVPDSHVIRRREALPRLGAVRPLAPDLVQDPQPQRARAVRGGGGGEEEEEEDGEHPREYPDVP